MKVSNLFFAFFIFCCSVSFSQSNYWQQHVDYKMVIDVNVENHTYNGKQKLVFTNNSPETLDRVFYHLYFNAFKPGTDLEQNSRYSTDDSRTMSKNILMLDENDWGDVQIKWMLQDGKPLEFKVEETILDVALESPVKSGESTTLEMEFYVQTPALVRRSGKKSEDGGAFSMSQW